MEVRRPISPKKVIEQYAATHGGPVHLREILALSLREGQLVARAFSREESRETHLERAWKASSIKSIPSSRKYSKEHDIARSVWWSSVSWADDILGWDFKQHRMHVTLSIDDSHRLLFAGVRFYENDIRKLLGAAPISIPLELKPLTKQEQWRRFWHELLVIVAGDRAHLKASDIGEKSSDDEVTGTLLNIFAQQDESWPDLASVDEALSEKIRLKLPFELGESTVLQEVKHLRQTLDIKRAYVLRKGVRRVR